jgi:hypothetical protein
VDDVFALEVRELTKRYGERIVAVDQLTMRVRRGPRRQDGQPMINLAVGTSCRVVVQMRRTKPDIAPPAVS